jgi:ATP-dependent helicase/nuclease subunit A
MTVRRTPPDEASRVRVRGESSRNVAVQAGAGTGKTTLIVDRVIALLESGQATMDSLAVVTFTRSAAAELRSRVREKLGEKGLEKPLREFCNAWIDTIHGFASRLLRENFSLTGTDPDFRSSSGGFDPLELERKWDGWLLSLPPADLDRWRTTLERVPSHVLKVLALELSRLRWLNDIGQLGPSGWEVLRIFADGSLREAEEALDTCSDPEHPKYVAFMEVSKWVRSMLDHPRPADPEDLNRLRDLLFSRKRGSARVWDDWNLANGILTRAREEFMSAVLPAVLAEPCREGTWELAHGLAVNLREEWDRDRSRLSFDDLLYMAWRAVSGNARLAGRMRSRFSHVLIDEFQDTSRDQVDLFRSILEEGGAIPPGRITVVADDKQSIYGWRSADIETYREFMGAMSAGRALFETISTNFRSTAGIVRFVNVFGGRLFDRMTDGEAPYGCGYSPIEPQPDAPEGEPVRVLTVPELPEGLPWHLSSPGYQALCQAEWLAGLVGEGIRRGGRAGDYAVLFRSTTHMHHFIDVLERERIAYFVDATRDYRTRPEIADLRELIRCLLDDGDRQAWIHSLRSLFFGLDDRTITDALTGGSTGYLREARDCPAAVAAAGRVLRTWRDALRGLPLSDFLTELLYTSELLPAIAASGYQEGRRLGNLQYILETVLAGSVASAEDLLVLLDEEFAPSATEETQIPPSDGSAVTLTTIHRAKGLSWRHVVVAAMSDRKNPPRNERLITDSHGLVAAMDLGYPLKLSGGKSVIPRTALWQRIAERGKCREQAESRRLIYVAVTRARETLTVFRSPEKEDSTSPSGLVWNSVETAVREDPECCAVEALEPPDLSGSTHTKSLPPPCDPSAFQPVPIPVLQPRVPGWQPEGARVGDMVHAVLEKLDFRDPGGWLDANAPSLRLLFGKRFREVRELAEGFFSMDLPFRLDECTIIGREYPISVKTPEGVRARYIDLLLDAGDRMIVVDYKTDDLAGRTVEEVAAEYMETQRAYRDDVAAIFGKPVLGFLVFLRPRLFMGT